MRFGSFVFPVSHDPEKDSAVIDSTLDEIILAEQIGMHSVWLTEHHFDGAAAHADPLVLGAAVAARTTNLKIGFAVVELAFPSPGPAGRPDRPAGQSEPRTPHRGHRAGDRPTTTTSTSGSESPWRTASPAWMRPRS